MTVVLGVLGGLIVHADRPAGHGRRGRPPLGTVAAEAEDT